MMVKNTWAKVFGRMDNQVFFLLIRQYYQFILWYLKLHKMY